MGHPLTRPSCQQHEGFSLGGHETLAPDRSTERDLQMITRTIKVALAALSAVALSATLLASPAHAADTGLYGSTPPDFDGVNRQSQAILALSAFGVEPARSAVRWLIEQQCADGSYQAYRPDTSVPCGPSDPSAFTGPNTDSTAWAAMALSAVGEDRAARRAANALVRNSQTAGRVTAWPSVFGGTPDASSTGLAVNALAELNVNSSAVSAGKRWLRARIIPCGRKYGGAMRKDAASTAADNFASTQGLLGLTEAIPVGDAADPRPNPVCSGSAVTRVSSYLARTLTNDGLLTYLGFGDDSDYGSTAVAVVALSSANLGRQGINEAVSALQRDARTWITTDGGDSVGAAAWLLMVAKATGENPRSFGGVNLVQTITGSIR